jgi:hypothetical protein
MDIILLDNVESSDNNHQQSGQLFHCIQLDVKKSGK